MHRALKLVMSFAVFNNYLITSQVTGYKINEFLTSFGLVQLLPH